MQTMSSLQNVEFENSVGPLWLFCALGARWFHSPMNTR